MLLLDSDWQMSSFQTFLTESASVRMEHAEDAVLSDGYEGAQRSINFLTGVKDVLDSNVSSSVNVTVKWDGSPSVYCGINPENGKFFVATHKIQNKEPVVNYTPEDIDQNHAGGPTEILKAALHYLPQLGIQNILQGDIMFGPGDVEEKVIGGREYITFKPNTILYAVPVESTLAQKILQAKLGIIFHTSYSGDSLKSLNKSFNVNVGELRQTRNVWFDDATYRDESGTVTLTSEEADKVDNLLDDAREILGQIGQNKLDKFFRENQKMVELIKRHLNSKVRQGEHIGDPKKHVDHLYNWLHDYFEKEADKKKTEKGASGQREMKRKKLNILDKQREFVVKLFNLIDKINEAKVTLIRHLEQIENIGHFVETENGWKVTAPEGFVAVDHLSDSAVKLVDRLEFSRANFAAAAKKGYK